MGEELYWSKLVTKALHAINGEDRFFEGYLTVEVKDKQGEITIVDELIKVLPIWMDRGAPISDTHSNRIIGKGISYAQTVYKDASGAEFPAIKVTGKIHKNYELDNEIWSKIKSGEYKGLSFGGATKSNRTPKVMKDGSVAYELKNLEHYEVAVCKDPAVPLALITDYNPIAKAMTENIEEREDGKMVIKCDKFGCFVAKDSNIGGEQIHAQGQRGLGHEHTYNQDSGIGTGITTTEVKDENEDEESEKDKEGKQDPETDGNNHGAYNQDVNENASSGRVGQSKKSDDGAKITKLLDESNLDHIKRYGHDKKLQYGKNGKPECKNCINPSTTQKSGYQTEDNNNQIGNTTRGDKDTNKDSEIYINPNKLRSSNNMSSEEESKQVIEDSEEEDSKEEKSESEEANKAFQETVKSNLDTLTDVIQSLAETQKSVGNTLDGIDNRLKALETPTDLPLKPSVEDSEDIGADVTVPDEYQSNSRQVGLDSDRHPNDGEKKPESDPENLSMQEKALGTTYSTETPRPSTIVDTVDKSFSQDYSPILKDARSEGYEGLANVARDILKGKYYTPSQDEVGQF